MAPELAFALAFTVVFLTVLALLSRGIEAAAEQSWRKLFADIERHEVPEAGDVIVTYRPYHGFFHSLKHFHHASLPPTEARILVGRLLRFNLTWGSITNGIVAILVVPLAVASWLAQIRSIAHQQETLESVIARGREPAPPLLPAPQSPPSREDRALFFRLLGWISGRLCALFAAFTIAFMVTGQYDLAIAGVLITWMLWGVAVEWN